MIGPYNKKARLVPGTTIIVYPLCCHPGEKNDIFKNDQPKNIFKNDFSMVIFKNDHDAAATQVKKWYFQK